MSDRSRLFPSGIVVRGLIRYYKERRDQSLPDNVRHFNFYTPRPIEQRARQRVLDLLGRLYGRDLAPGWQADVVIETMEPAPDEMAGHREQFLPSAGNQRIA